MRTKFITTMVLLGVMASPTFAQAPGDLLVNFTNVGHPDSSLLYVSTDGGNSDTQGWVGRYTGQLGTQDINDFCVDVNHDITFPQSFTADVSHNLADASNPTPVGNYFNGGLASALDSGYYDPVTPTSLTNQQRANEVSYLVHTYDNANVSTFTLTGVSLAIWDIEQDGGDGASSGLVQLDHPSEAATYGSLVDSLESQASAYKNTSFLDVKWIQAPIAGGGLQSFAYVAPVPEAGTMTLFALLLAAGIFRLRTVRKKKQAAA